MVGHYGLPAIVGDRTTPTSVSSTAIRGLIRKELGFAGVIVTDALDMGGFGGYPAEAPLDAGANLLLYGPAQIGQLPRGTSRSDTTQVADLLSWLSNYESVPGPLPMNSQLAAELAARATTLVRDQTGLLPLRLGGIRSHSRHHAPTHRPYARRHLVNGGSVAGRSALGPTRSGHRDC